MKNLSKTLCVLIPIICFVSLISFGVCESISEMHGYSVWDLNFENKSIAKDWKFPTNCKLLYSADKNKYQVSVGGTIWGDGRLNVFRDLWIVDVDIENRESATSFTDSITAKYYLYIYCKMKHSPDSFKPLTK